MNRVSRALQGGQTLSEVLVALGLVGLILAAVGEISLAARHVFVRTTEGAASFREVSLASFRIARELRMCQELYHPSPESLGSGPDDPLESTKGESLVLVFRRRGAPSRPDMVVGLRLDARNQVLERIVYDPGIPLGDPPRGRILGPPRRLAGGVERMALWSVDPAQRHGSRFLGLELAPREPSGGAGRLGSPLRVECRVGDL